MSGWVVQRSQLRNVSFATADDSVRACLVNVHSGLESHLDASIVVIALFNHGKVAVCGLQLF